MFPRAARAGSSQSVRVDDVDDEPDDRTIAVWVSYAVAVLCLSDFWSGGMACAAFALWLIGAVIGVLRAARRTPPSPAGFRSEALSPP